MRRVAMILIMLVLVQSVAAVSDFQIGFQGAQTWNSGENRCKYDLTQEPPASWTNPLSAGGGSTQMGIANNANSNHPQCFRIWTKATSGADIADKDYRICYSLIPASGAEVCTSWASEGGSAGATVSSSGDANQIYARVETRDLDSDLQCFQGGQLSLSLNGGPSVSNFLTLGTGSFNPVQSAWGHTPNSVNIRTLSMQLTTTQCTPVRIVDVRASSTTPPPNTNVTVWCQSTVADVTSVNATTNISSIVISPIGWTGDERGFTFNVSTINAINVSCAVSGNVTTAKGITVNPGVVQGPNAVTGLTAQPDCAFTPPNVSIGWIAVPGATKYNVYKDNVKIGTTSATRFDVALLTGGSSYTFAVSAVNAADVEGSRSTKTISALCVVSPRELYLPPARFQRAFFSSVQGHNITAYWDGDGAVFVYQNFAYDFSLTMPENGEYALLKNSRQVIKLDENDAGMYWRPYTSALRVSRITGAAFGGAVRGVQGYNSNTDTYTDGIAPDSDYLILYGQFLKEGGNEVYIGSVKYIPTDETPNQINVKLVGTGVTRPAASTGPVSVYVQSGGMTSNTAQISVA